MLIEFRRYNPNGGENTIAVNPATVGALFEGTQGSDVSIIRLLDGRGLTLLEGCREVLAKITAAGSTMVQFARSGTLSEGEERPIYINPAAPAAVFESTTSGTVIIRMADGRGFSVLGTYQEVMTKLGNSSSGSDNIVQWPPRSELDIN